MPLYVNVAGNDANPGTQTSPFRTVQKLASTLSAANPIGYLMGNVVFTGNVSIRTPGITLRNMSDGTHSTIRGQVRVERSATGARVSGLILDNRTTWNPLIYANNTRIDKCDISNHSAAIGMIIDEYGSGPRPTGIVIEKNRIHHNGHVTNMQHGLYLSGGDGLVIRDNWIFRNADRGAQIYPDGQNNVFEYNTFDSNGANFGIIGDVGKVANGNVFRNNIVSNALTGWNVYGLWSPGHVGTGNRVENNFGQARANAGGYSGSPAGSGIMPAAQAKYAATGNVAGNPQYINAAAGDYRLATGSPAAAYGARAFPAWLRNLNFDQTYS